MTGTSDGTGGGSGMTHEQMREDARKTLAKADSEDVGSLELEEAATHARAALSLMDNAEALQNRVAVLEGVLGNVSELSPGEMFARINLTDEGYSVVFDCMAKRDAGRSPILNKYRESTR